MSFLEYAVSIHRLILCLLLIYANTMCVPCRLGHSCSEAGNNLTFKRAAPGRTYIFMQGRLILKTEEVDLTIVTVPLSLKNHPLPQQCWQAMPTNYICHNLGSRTLIMTQT